MNLIELIKQPWPWYVAGPLIGLTIPVLLLIGNRSFGISSSLRHICAACMPSNINYFNYAWKKEIWNLFFVFGILMGGFIAMQFLSKGAPIVVNDNLRAELSSYGITQIDGLLPEQLFNWNNLLSIKGFIMVVVGGFLIGFGTRYADGCTSGHAIMGISNLQMSSVIATCCFMVGGFIMANLILPFILSL
jgi:uncharacterized membrane protein YedE/YeeE